MKRIFDVLVSTTALVTLSPIYLFVSILVLFKLGRPILFCQQRPGFNGSLFKMYKFRSMLNASREGCLENVKTDAVRLTRFGKWLRATSLDELPGLWNVIKGDMSLVGPRPLLVEYLPLYTNKQARRHEVKPGITGWAQVNGRNNITWEEKFEHDVWYVDNMSLMLDIKILLRTILKVMKRSDITSTDSATSNPYSGSEK
ncbi:sugar transferase [Enterovibrio norvegicus]|uniref:Sugar transferase n=1 Tax=Enterovibrio norvegicus TaxID=188144 RepID=A0A2N7L649_9GAMM|nr:sugar transferase [Enterovibrio norvegicus]PMN67529.1 sugar transferase [Enterovibrio norvegicus]PMN89118.1 sugar transferase [Enterovibrio norvegicus]